MNDVALRAEEIADLRCLAGMIVPASSKYDVPGADDDTIFADILGSLGRDFDRVRAAVARLCALADGSFAALDGARRVTVAGALRAQGGSDIGAVSRVVLFCYYRDDRVMRSLGMEPGPPFPKGYEVEQGDWSLLDVVRERKPFWRSTT